ncbi:MAG: DUF3990 domain-containing protein [Bacilli bacterium]|nr:DUF3990 domain-containing protein [Bacilli bacterium]
MDIKISQDMKLVRELLGISQADLAEELGVEILTIQRIENEVTRTSKRTIENFYNFVYNKKIYLNKIKEMFYLEDLREEKLLFHGSKNNIDTKRSRKNNDFGQGFYCGESYEQAAAFVENFEDSKIYYFAFDTKNLKSLKYIVDQNWMLTIAYFRGTLDKYKEHQKIKKLISKLNEADYIIAPIADNKMFRIIDSFIRGEITDEQCKHCLSATNLGYQYVLLTDNAIGKLRTLECCYMPVDERKNYRRIKTEDNKISEDKVRLARIKYRGKGQYIDEILK